MINYPGLTISRRIYGCERYVIYRNGFGVWLVFASRYTIRKKNSCTSHLVYVMIQLLSFSFSVSTGSVVNRGGREGRKT